MKKYLSLALALPLLFACSNDLDVIEEVKVSNDPFEGIEKVDATFSMDEPTTRMANDWALEDGDMYGFAWMQDPGSVLTCTGVAYQNHPLTQESGRIFVPKTSIYVGEYYLYRPYDYTVVNIENINFNSLKEQTVSDGMGGANWSSLAKNAIIIGDKWTSVTKTGWTDLGGNVWDKAGIGNNFKLYAAFFSNQTALDLTYKKNNLKFDGKKVAGATDIDYTYPTGSEIGAAEIYDGVKVQLDGAHNSFKYAPTSQPNSGSHSGSYWADKKNLGATEGFMFPTSAEPVVLNFDGEKVSTDTESNKGWFWFNSLPNETATAALTSNVEVVLETAYGVVTVTKTLKDCAYVLEKYNSTSASAEWIKLADVDNNLSSPKTWNLAGSHNTFVNQYGNHKGKYALEVDFSTGVMNGMHIKNDEHLQKALKYYIASGKTENVSLNLDGASATDKTFKLSKLSIALLQTINASAEKVKVHACTSHNTPKIIITQDGQDAIGLAAKTEVPALNKVFDAITEVYLSKDCNWTWSNATALPIDTYVKSITNEGTLTVNATNVELSVSAAKLANAKGATMNITKVTTVKNDLTNLGTINVGSAENTAAELRAYNAEITNDATSLTAYGEINNYGVVGVTYGTTGKFNNYAKITMMSSAAITLLTSNEISGADFDAKFDASTNKLGTVVLPENDPYAIVSVSNAAETGFIKYNWTAGTYTHDSGNVKYNTIVVSNDITFTGAYATEVQFIEFNGTRTKVVNPATADKLTNLKGIIVNAGKSIIIEKTNKVNCLVDAYLGAGATVYNGGEFTKNGYTFSGSPVENYLGTWSTDQLIVY